MYVKVLGIGAVALAASVTFGGARAAAGGEGRGAAAYAGPAGTALHRRLPGIRPSTLRSRAAAAPSYTVNAVGAPTVNSLPTSFNNTGQILGQGDTGCFVYDAGSFERLPIPSAGTQYIDCRAASINDAAPDGTFQVNGTTGNPYAQGTYAFAVTRGQAIVYYAYGDSTILGINNNAISVAAADFYPVRTTDLSGEQFYTGFGGTGYLSLLQAPASGVAPVHYLLPVQTYDNSPCPFGGCVINDRNQVLGYDFFTAGQTNPNLAISTVGKPGSLVDLPLTVDVFSSYSQCCNSVGFNNAGQIIYNAAGSAGSFDTDTPAIFDSDSGKSTIIPLVTPSCPKGGHGAPMSLNDNGEVLGNYHCTNFYGYFTWDAATGTHDLSLQIPNTNFTLFPVGVNDHGQILIGLTVGYDVTSWGTLDPIVPGVKKKAGTVRTSPHEPHATDRR